MDDVNQNNEEEKNSEPKIQEVAQREEEKGKDHKEEVAFSGSEFPVVTDETLSEMAYANGFNTPYAASDQTIDF